MNKSILQITQISKFLTGVLSSTIPDQNSDTEITGISNNTKELASNNVYVAIKGFSLDGHVFIKDALSKGASLIILDNKEFTGNFPHILVKNSRIALAEISALFFKNPSQHLKVIGVTGTNGKTTTNWMIYHLLNLLKSPCLRIGTLGTEGILTNGEKTLVNNETLTTGDSIFIQKILNQAVGEKLESAVMEVSSHALDQERVRNIDFDVAIFTNLTQDHLDYHLSFENYFKAKKKLFDQLDLSKKVHKTAIINTNSEYGKTLFRLSQNKNYNIITFGDEPENYIQIKEVNNSIKNNSLILKIDKTDYKVDTSFIGHHNAENIACTIATGLALGYDLIKILSVISKIPQVPGRLESCGNNKIGIFVDYAHTPDALLNVLKSMRDVAKKRLLVLFGCGGDRDKTKRPRMLEAASSLADSIIVTSDNPRTEDPNKIIEDILSEGHKADIVEADRRIAIKKAIKIMSEGDVLIIAGKGHEDYQIIGKEKHHFSDQEEVKKVLEGLG